MSRPVAQAVIDSGIIDANTIAQLQRWGFLLDVQPGGPEEISAADIAQNILDAVESEEAVELRSTDLDIIKEYLKSRKKARLHVPDPAGDKKTVGIPVDYCLTQMGEVVIPWTSEAIHDLLLDEETYLKPIGEERIYFADVRELFYDDHKAFVVCTLVRGK